MKFSTRLVRLIFSSSFFVLLATPASALEVNPDSLGGHHDSPVFFEMFADSYIELKSAWDNLTLLPEGKVLIPPFETKELGDFTWETGQSWNLSWALRLQDFCYLLPLIEKYGEEHRSFIKNWFLQWDLMHQNQQKPNHGAWENMTTGIRAMILVYFLKKEEGQIPRDQQLITALRSALREHQKFLVDETHFDNNSNHGMWEAIALVELGRLFPDQNLKEMGLSRLLLLARKSVSGQGVHREHSPAYHFVFMNWLLDFSDYLKSIPDLNWDRLPQLEKISQSMMEAAYFLQDHHGNIPLIGDSDEMRLADKFIMKKTRDTDGLFFDKAAGYAIFKDSKRSRARRYITFNIQNLRPELPYHFHNDALAVYFNYDGEVILSDQGKYSYTWSNDRRYFTSCGAHNVIVPPMFLEPGKGLGATWGFGKILLAQNPWFRTASDRIIMGAKLTRNYRFNTLQKWMLFKSLNSDKPVTGKDAEPSQVRQEISKRYKTHTFWVNRRITIPRDKPEFMVEDVVGGDSQVVLVWNIGPDVAAVERLETDSDETGRRYEWLLVTKKRKKFKMTVEVDGEVAADDTTVLIKRGETSPLFGWYAPKFMKKTPSTVILVHLKKPSEVWVTTRLEKVR
jgi:hypothetical protein